MMPTLRRSPHSFFRPMERICRQNTGLFPKPADITFSCSCMDHASMCKHVAGVTP